MFGTDKLVLQSRHLFLGGIEDTPEIVPDPLIDSGAGDPRESFKIGAKALPERFYRNPHFFQQRLGDTFRLIEEREKEMFIRDFLLIQLRRCVLRGLKGLLHFLGKFFDPHT